MRDKTKNIIVIIVYAIIAIGIISLGYFTNNIKLMITTLLVMSPGFFLGVLPLLYSLSNGKENPSSIIIAIGIYTFLTVDIGIFAIMSGYVALLYILVIIEIPMLYRAYKANR